MRLDMLLIAWSAMMGACIGSFLNVVAYRMPRGMSLVHPGSRCPHCGHAIRGYDNVPVLGWIWLRGRCRDCHAAISPRYPLVEAWVGLACGAVAFVDLYQHDITHVELARLGLHATLVCGLVAFALVSLDRQPTPLMLMTVPSVMASMLVLWFPEIRVDLQPSAVDVAQSGLAQVVPTMGEALVAVGTGMLAAIALAAVMPVPRWAAGAQAAKESSEKGRTSRGDHPYTTLDRARGALRGDLAGGLLLVGVALGWWAAAQIALGMALLVLAACLVNLGLAKEGRGETRARFGPALLLVVTLAWLLFEPLGKQLDLRLPTEAIWRFLIVWLAVALCWGVASRIVYSPARPRSR